MRVVIANDHAAVAFKYMIKEYLESKGYEVLDMGSTDPNAADDYPDFGEKAALAVADGTADRGVLICGTGVGMALTANKVRGIRAGVCSDTTTARLIVQHNDCNIICFGERIVGAEAAKDILDAYFGAEFMGGKHAARVAKIMAVEERQSQNL